MSYFEGIRALLWSTLISSFYRSAFLVNVTATNKYITITLLPITSQQFELSITILSNKVSWSASDLNVSVNARFHVPTDQRATIIVGLSVVQTFFPHLVASLGATFQFLLEKWSSRSRSLTSNQPYHLLASIPSECVIFSSTSFWTSRNIKLLGESSYLTRNCNAWI